MVDGDATGQVAPLHVLPKKREEHVTQMPTSHGQLSNYRQPFHVLQNKDPPRFLASDVIVRIPKVGQEFDDKLGRKSEDYDPGWMVISGILWDF